MALTAEDNINIQKQEKNLLDIGASEYYFDKLRPALLDFNTKYHTDRELNRTITEVINHADSAASGNKFHDLEDSYVNLLSCVQSKGYTTSGPMRYGSDEEKNAVRSLIDKFSDLTMILKYEQEPEEKKHEIRERLNYKPPIGGERGYNLDDLSNRGPKPNKERIPNMDNYAEKYAY